MVERMTKQEIKHLKTAPYQVAKRFFAQRRENFDDLKMLYLAFLAKIDFGELKRS
jgi:hypothetical protein